MKRCPAVIIGYSFSLKQYIKNDEGFTLTEEQIITFRTGGWVFPNTVDSAVLNVIMEPDFNYGNPERKMNILRMGLIAADEAGTLPIYRYCHTLEDGKVACLTEAL